MQVFSASSGTLCLKVIDIFSLSNQIDIVDENMISVKYHSFNKLINSKKYCFFAVQFLCIFMHF